MLGLISIIFFYLGLSLLGYLFTQLIFPTRDHQLEKLALSFLLGSSIFAYLAFLLMSYFSLSFTVLNLIIIYLLVTTMLFLGLRQKNKKLLPHLYKEFKENLKNIVHFFKTPSLSRLLAMLIIIISVSIFIQSMFWPISDWDSLVLFDYRSKVLAHTGSLLSAVSEPFTIHYPIHISILHGLSYLSKSNQHFWYVCSFLSLLLCFFLVLLKRTNLNTAVIASFFLSTAPLLYTQAQLANPSIIYAVLLALGYIYQILWIKKPKRFLLVISILLLAFATWLRNTEPFWVLAVFLSIYGVIKHRIYEQIPFIFFMILILIFFQQPWNNFVQKHLGYSTTISKSLYQSEKVSFSLNDLKEKSYNIKYFLSLSLQPVLEVYLPAVVIVLLYGFYTRDINSIENTMILFLLIFMIVAASYVLTFLYDDWLQIPNSLKRISLFLIPISLFTIFDSSLWQKIQSRFLS